MSEFKTFKDTRTGLVGDYPAHFGERESFVEVSPEDYSCIGCMEKDDKDAKPKAAHLEATPKVAATITRAEDK